MSRRSNPWPAYVDLFGALLVATFGGLMLLSAAYSGLEKEHADLQATLNAMELRIRTVAEEIQTASAGLTAPVRKCGNDICVDLYVHFARNIGGEIADIDEINLVRDVCSALKTGLDGMGDDRRFVEVFVEGHTDNTQPFGVSPREAFVFNWNLSARRAATVLYECAQQGVQPPEYRITSVGYADTQPLLCEGSVEECHAMNRRTTFRLHLDTRQISETPES